MKKSAAIAIVGCALAAALTLALAAPERSLPERVGANSWIWLGSDAGFAITNPPAREPHGADKAVRGNFYARRNGDWVRLIPESQAQTIPAY